ncbi:NAD-dependent epimerase/dehydratase family protein [Candidatus Uhrbacteria bacterium]|nr:NAD-dependent epimerase/dehydratase family protein [Candidatus Uhrbacteria bacterium]
MAKIPIFEKKNVLVTGGAGFIGSHLCENLLKVAKVICIDDLLSGGQLSNIEHLLKYPDFEFIKHDVAVPFDLNSWPELKKFKTQFQGVQEIYHLACPTAPLTFEQNKIKILKANAQATLNVLDLAVLWKSKVFFSSSSVVYGKQAGGNRYIAEEELGIADQLSPHACYDEGKRFAETAYHTFSQVYGLDARIARVFRTYGPRLQIAAGEMIPDLILNALEGKPLIIYGDKNFTTSLCYITDMVDGILKLMDAEQNFGPVNLGSDEEQNLAQVAGKIIELTKSTSKIVFKPPLLFMRPQPLPDIRQAKDALGWFPVVRLEEGLSRMIEYTRATKHLLGVK